MVKFYKSIINLAHKLVMNSFVSKLGVSLVAFALVVAPTLALAQSVPLSVSIDTPADGAEFVVDETITFSITTEGVCRS